MRCTGLGFINYNLNNNTRLPSHDAIMGHKHNKLQLVKVPSTYNFGEEVIVEGHHHHHILSPQHSTHLRA
ncbi:MAG: hypothetical protein AAGJ80_08590 [Cyanobacteria bacterium J06553_1]